MSYTFSDYPSCHVRRSLRTICRAWPPEDGGRGDAERDHRYVERRAGRLGLRMVSARPASLGDEQPYMAALAYGWAKFPCLANDAKTTGARRSSDGLPCGGAGLSRQIRAADCCDALRGRDGGAAGASLFRQRPLSSRTDSSWSAAASIPGKWTSTGCAWSSRNASA